MHAKDIEKNINGNHIGKKVWLIGWRHWKVEDVERRREKNGKEWNEKENGGIFLRETIQKEMNNFKEKIKFLENNYNQQ